MPDTRSPALFPLFADLDGRPVLVVGAGSVAERKVRRLLACGAQVRVGAEQIGEALAQLARQGAIACTQASFDPSWLDDVWLVVAATDDPALNRQVSAAARSRRLWCNVVDDAALSSYHSPAVIDRAPLVVAVSSGGSAPALARRVRAQIETVLPPFLGRLFSLAESRRTVIRRAFPDLSRRRAFYDWLLDGPVWQALRRARGQEACDGLARALNDAESQTERPGTGRVTLVGGGPGDPDLLTLAGLRALQTADVILYDHLVGEAVLDLARRDAERIPVGKRPGEDHDATQARIHALMLMHASAGRHVVRLKGGDSFIFGRGGEELEYLADHGVAYAVVPGVTAALACAAYAGVPLTHRDHAQSVRLITAHRRDAWTEREWQDLARPGQTLAFYMGVAHMEQLAHQLQKHGCSPDTPFALVEHGTREQQRVLYGELGNLPAQMQAHALSSPALLLVGSVARLGPRLAWFGRVLTDTRAPATAQSAYETMT